MKDVNTALGLKADADESQARTAIESLRGIERDVLLLSGKSTINDAFAVLLAFKEKAARADALDAELLTLKAEKTKDEIATLLDAAIKDGRVRPASRANFESLAQSKGVDALQLCLAELPRATAPALPPGRDSPDVMTGFTSEQLKILKMIGADPVAVAKHRTESPAFRAAEGKED